MKILIERYWKIALSTLFGIAVFLFWLIPYVSALSFQEQYQLFLFDSDYFTNSISVPGGLADYVAEFLTQFYYIPVIGAMILAVFYVLVQRLIWLLAKRNGADDIWYTLSFVPSILIWFYMGDENVMLSFIVSLIVVLWSMLHYNIVSNDEGFPKNKLRKILYLFLWIPVFYWLFGANVLIIALYVILYELIKNRSFETYLYSVCIVVYTIALILVSSTFLQYPLYRLFGGIGYYRFPAIIPIMQLLIMALIAVLPIVLPSIPNVRKQIAVSLVSLLVLIIGGFFFVKSGYDKVKYNLIDYDYLVRTQQWDKILSKAEKQQATTPMGVACVNLALAQTGQLGDRMFEFYQNGTEGLLPAFERDFTSPLSTSEVYYRLGMINTAQRYMFEAQEAIPNFRKSGRCTERIAETNIINGQYSVAAKYLRMLQKTLFYRKWADNAMTYLYNDKKINANPVWGKLRKYRYTKDFLFSDTEMDQMFGLLFVHNYKNKMAFEYLLAYELLNRDIQKFMKYYPLGRYANFDHIPVSYQEVLVYTWTQNHPNFNGMPWSISPEVEQNVAAFAQAYMTNPNDPSLKEGVFGKTYWSYLLLKKQ